MPNLSLKDQLIDLLDSEMAAEQACIQALSPEERLAESSFERWTLKDVLGHSASWKLRSSEILLARLKGLAPPVEEELEVTNRTFFEQCRNYSWEDMQDLIRRAQAGMLSVLAEHRPESLLVEQDGRVPAHRVINNGVWHPALHLAYYQIERGLPQAAVDWMAEMGKQVLAFDDSLALWRIVVYDQGCICARAGRKEEALELLARTFTLAPDLKDWARQDPDLVSLRGEPLLE